MANTSAPVGGTVTSGVFPNNTYPLVSGKPDAEQEKRLQARQEHDFVTGKRATRPPYTKQGPGVAAKPGA